MLTVPKRGNSTLIRVAKETSELANKCADELDTTKTFVVAVAVQEFYEKYLKEGGLELVS